MISSSEIKKELNLLTDIHQSSCSRNLSTGLMAFYWEYVICVLELENDAGMLPILQVIIYHQLLTLPVHLAFF